MRQKQQRHGASHLPKTNECRSKSSLDFAYALANYRPELILGESVSQSEARIQMIESSNEQTLCNPSLLHRLPRHTLTPSVFLLIVLPIRLTRKIGKNLVGLIKFSMVKRRSGISNIPSCARVSSRSWLALLPLFSRNGISLISVCTRSPWDAHRTLVTSVALFPFHPHLSGWTVAAVISIYSVII